MLHKSRPGIEYFLQKIEKQHIPLPYITSQSSYHFMFEIMTANSPGEEGRESKQETLLVDQIIIRDKNEKFE